MIRTALTLTALLSASTALAAGDALVIGNARYSAFDSVFGTARVGAAADALRERGLSVAEARDAGPQALRAAFAEFVAGLEPGDAPVVAVLSGVFLHGASGSWLLPVQDAAPDAADAMTGGLSIDAVLSVLAEYPGRALLVLGESATDEGLAPFLRPGPGALDIPQGVTVLRGPAGDVARFAASDLVRADQRLGDAAERWELDLEGYAPRDFVLLRATDVSDPVRQPEPLPRNDAEADDAAWTLAQEADTQRGYRTYLNGFPNGAHADAARQRLAAIDEDPFYRERRAEDALELNREARREIQRDLSLLGYNTRGIDGIFGQGTRSAIDAWQGDNGLRRSAYLNADQIDRLDRQAADRAAELEAEAERERAERERQDRIAWEAVTGPNDESGLRSYLERYPDGLFADRARQLIGEIENRRANSAAGQDRQAFQAADQVGDIDAYRAYLQNNPNGAFREEAQASIREIERNQAAQQDRSAGQRAEESLNLNPVARRLAEARLSQLGLNPGEVDGRFDGATREAIRRYQQDRGLRASGFLDQDTVVRLLADGILGRN